MPTPAPALHQARLHSLPLIDRVKVRDLHGNLWDRIGPITLERGSGDGPWLYLAIFSAPSVRPSV